MNSLSSVRGLEPRQASGIMMPGCWRGLAVGMLLISVYATVQLAACGMLPQLQACKLLSPPPHSIPLELSHSL
jgi:hypothetical protein